MSAAVASPSPVPAVVTTFKKTQDTGSGPNPGDFPIISLIDDTAGLNYYDNVLQNINRRIVDAWTRIHRRNRILADMPGG